MRILFIDIAGFFFIGVALEKITLLAAIGDTGLIIGAILIQTQSGLKGGVCAYDLKGR